MVMDPPPIRQIGWQGNLTYTRDPRRLPAPADNPWRPCPTCWGQRREYMQLGNEWRYRACVTCLGLGDVPSTGRTR